MKLLDVCCGAGGCSVGYARAGFEVIGCDLFPQPEYPFTFIQTNALEIDFAPYDIIHLSPPCPRFSVATRFNPGKAESHEDLLTPLRVKVLASGKPYILENVVGAPLHKPIRLCGTMFGLRVYRHRLFESNLPIVAPTHPKHLYRSTRPGRIPQAHEFWCVAGHFGNKQAAAEVLGVEWMSKRKNISDAIPPAYTYYLGLQAMHVLQKQCKGDRSCAFMPSHFLEIEK